MKKLKFYYVPFCFGYYGNVFIDKLYWRANEIKNKVNLYCTYLLLYTSDKKINIYLKRIEPKK